MSLPNPEPTIHQAEWRERRTRLVPALAILLVAGVLTVLPLPGWLQWGRPEWVALILIYWCIALPHRVGIATGLAGAGGPGAGG